ncbi:MAG: Imm63 family immunity protein [Nocardioides sp.]
MTDDDVQAEIDGYAARLGVTRTGDWSPVPDRVNRDSGYPFWRREGDRFVYAAHDRGQESMRCEAHSVDDLLFRVTSGVASRLVQDHELAHRRPDEDSRRQWFGLWVELMAGLRPDWGERVAAYVADVLRTAAYVDRPDA